MNALTHIRFKKSAVTVLLAGIIAIAVFIFHNYFYKQQVAIAEERDSLTATGTIEARTAMAAFKIPGKIETLLVDEGARVEQGQELARLDSSELNAKLAQAEGAYAAAQGQINQASNSVIYQSQQIEAKIKQAEAGVAAAEVGVKDAQDQVNAAEVGVKDAKDQLNNAKDLYDRLRALHDQGAIDDRKLEEAKNGYERAQNAYNAAQISYERAQNGYNAAQKKLQEAQALLDQAISARTGVAVAQAQQEAAAGQGKQAGGAVQEANAYLADAVLKAPLAGFITQKLLEQGEMVNAGTPVYEITDLLHTYVKVYISEKKIGRVHLGQEAEITVDAFPGKVFKGKVVWINDAGEFAVKKAINDQYEHDIRSFEVKIDVPNPDLVLKTGMTARVKILEGEQQ
ncbi:HlyD family secretion protein [Moorella sp. Hama-1]|uniref:HlyD family secretion protein n=1 Tax=Moorella sp. Hama-1 TaxID=2138101 RepID=UPI000D646145|nr:efflux RND transporter periplasmic adaptor subunit [Moorella sp. Hama-1]BCV22966.1 secretion protein HlyD [Moorella sp. Hama-1]